MKLRLGVVLAGAAAALTGACAAGTGGGAANTGAPSPTPGAEVLAQGERPRENEHTRAAANHLEQAQEAGTPEAARPHYQAAVASAEEAIALDERNPLPWLQAGRAYLGLEDYPKADSALKRAEELRPIYQLETESIREQAWIDLYQQAAPHVNAGEYAEAVPHFENANAIYDARPEVMIALGQIYIQLEEYDKGLENLRNAMAIIESDRMQDVDSATAASWREQAQDIPVIIAQSLIQAGRYQEAADALRDLIAADPENSLLIRNLASVYVQMQQPDSARALYERLLARTDLLAGDYYTVGVGFYNMEDFQAAADAFEAAASQAPKDRDALEMWARSLQIQLQDQEDGSAEADPALLQELEDAAQRWADLDPYSRNAYVVLAQTVNKAGKEDRTRELVRHIEQLPISVESLEARKPRIGGATVMGTVRNLSAEPGQTVTLRFTFYDRAGNAMGSESATVTLPAQDATQVFSIDFQSDQQVWGYGYTTDL